MPPNEVLYIAKNSVMLIYHLSMPSIVAATLVGLLVALMQTLIQLQEQTLAFGVKLVAIIAVFFILGGSMANELMLFMNDILTRVRGL